MIFYINVYSVGRASGGSEEGGWWYNAGEFVRCEGKFSWTPSSVIEKKADFVPENGCDRGYGYDAIEQVISEITREAEKIRKSVEGKADKRNLMGNGEHDGCDPSGEPDDAYIMRGGTWGDTELEVRIEDHVGRDFPDSAPYYE
jgi:hypothetical protein